MDDFTTDQLGQTFPQVHWGHQQYAVTVLSRIAGEVIEKVRSICAEFRIGGKKSDIGVNPRRHRVVIAGAQVHITPKGILLLPDDERNLQMCFQPDQTVNYVNARLLQSARPLNIVLFVETSLK